MTSLNLSEQSARQLDIEKRKLEARLLSDIKKIFRNISIDASNLYKATGNLPNKELASNYNSDFIKEIRDIFRTTIKKFGFQIRKDIEKKHGLFFDAEYKSKLLGLELKQTITIEDQEVSEKLEEVNNKFAQEATFFIANQSEEQTEYIEETNSKMLELAVLAASFKYDKDLQKLREDGQSDLIFTKNKNSIVASNIKKELNNKIDSRSQVIVDNNVGIAESWSRQKEAELIDDAELIGTNQQIIKLNKKWISILDAQTRTGRFDHVAPDGQTVGVKDFFLVSGEQLSVPRDTERGSLGNKINCRCIASYEV